MEYRYARRELEGISTGSTAVELSIAVTSSIYLVAGHLATERCDEEIVPDLFVFSDDPVCFICSFLKGHYVDLYELIKPRRA
jgi:hypothetical protein